MLHRCLGRLIVCLTAAALVLFSAPCLVFGAEGESVRRSRECIEDVLSLHCSGDGDGIDGWINGELTGSAGFGAEWYVLALSQYVDCDLSSYEAALLRYLENNGVPSASSRLKYALCLAACGSNDGYIAYALENSVGEQGLMSLVFGLHLLNNGYTSKSCTLADVKARILGMQLDCGGWSVTSADQGDVDATAMVVQALAPWYEKDADAELAVERALSFLSASQLENGGFASYGVPNPESAAQVLVALSALGISPDADERFINNGKTVLDGMMEYRLSDGRFSHTSGGDANEAATVQCFYAAVACVRSANGAPSLYMLDRATPSLAKDAADASVWQASTQLPDGARGSGAPDVKLIISIAAVVIGAATCVFLLVRKKRSVKDAVAVVVAVAVIIGCTYGLDIRSADGYYGDGEDGEENVIGEVSFAVRCDTVAGRAEHIPDDGVVLDTVTAEISEGDTVYTVLVKVLRLHRIQCDTSGTSIEPYISGIANIYEFDFGSGSGWMYYVNGVSPSVGAGSYVLRPGDNVVWRYTCDFGNDTAQLDLRSASR